jgi:hypothetical protein
VSPLFGNKEKKAAEEEAARAEFERLMALPVTALAVEIMPAFGPDGPRPSGGKGINILQVLSYMTRGTPRLTKYGQQLMDPLREGVQLLEQSGLLQGPTAVAAAPARG